MVKKVPYKRLPNDKIGTELLTIKQYQILQLVNSIKIVSFTSEVQIFDSNNNTSWELILAKSKPHDSYSKIQKSYCS